LSSPKSKQALFVFADSNMSGVVGSHSVTLSFFQIEMGQHGPMGPADKSSEQANTDTYFHV
jgi:hypothetical protein